MYGSANCICSTVLIHVQVYCAASSLHASLRVCLESARFIAVFVTAWFIFYCLRLVANLSVGNAVHWIVSRYGLAVRH